MSLYIFDILIYYIYVCVPHFYDLSALVGCWSSVSIRRIIYNFLNVCPIDYTAVSVSGKVERSRTDLTTAVGWLLLLQLIVLSRSAINRCVIAVFVLSRCFLDFSVGVGAFVIWLSQISSFFYSFKKTPNKQTNKQTLKPSQRGSLLLVALGCVRFMMQIFMPIWTNLWFFLRKTKLDMKEIKKEAFKS